MASITKHISKPSQRLIDIMKTIEMQKEERREKLRSKADLYFPVKKK